MTEEEYFRKNYPDSCYGDKPLSPHWDFFQDRVEFGERQSEKRIAEFERKLEQTEKDLADYQFNYPTIKELQKENAKLKERNRKLLESCEGATMMYEDLCKAKEIIKTFLGFAEAFGYSPSIDKFITEAEQFLKGIKEND